MKKIKVYVTACWENDQSLFESIKKYGFGGIVWKNIEFTDGPNFDWAVILRGLNKESHPYNPEKAITFFTEPYDAIENLRHQSKYISSYIPLSFWTNIEDKHYSKVTTVGKIKKIKIISTVTSDLAVLEGHSKRLQVIHLLDQVIEEGYDAYGKIYSNKFYHLIKNYRGVVNNKFDALWKYRYHFACENSFIDNYFTEKIVDPIIAESLCFYDGCPNIDKFIDSRSFIRVNVQNPKKTVETIVEAIQAKEWNKRIKFIREQKYRLLTELNPLNYIYKAINKYEDV